MLLASDPPARQGQEGEDDDPHRLVPVLESADVGMVQIALGRLDAMGLPHSDPELHRLGLEDPDSLLAAPVRILVAQGLRGRAERCLFGLEELREAYSREMERHGFPAGTEEIPPAEMRYCPRCGRMHHGFSRCVDCDVPLVAEEPARAEARRVKLFSTLDVDELAAVRRTLFRAGIPFEWGRLTWGAGGDPGEPGPSPIIPAGYVYVIQAREQAAREAVRQLTGPALETAEVDEEESAEDLDSAATAEEPFEEPEELEPARDEDDLAGAEDGTLYCPRCRTEYRPGFSRCADCGVTLVDRLPAVTTRRPRVGHDPAEIRCVNCGAPLASVTAVCTRCSPPDDDEESAPSEDGPGMESPAAAPAAWWALSTGLPNARADHRRIQELHRAARFAACCGVILLPWISEVVAFRLASQALAIIRSYGAGEHPLERRIERLRWFALAYCAAAWLALAAWLVERRPF